MRRLNAVTSSMAPSSDRSGDHSTTGNADPLVPVMQRLPPHRPEPPGEVVAAAVLAGDVGDRRDVDHREVEAACPEVEEGADRPLVEQRGQCDDERLGREDAPGNHLDRRREIRAHQLGLDERVDDAVLLAHAHRRGKPAEDAAEADEPDAVPALQVRVGERRRRPDGLVDGPFARPPRLGEAVEEEDHVARSLGVALVDVHPLAAGARPPVDAADAVAGRERADIGELDSLPLGTGHLAAGERGRVVGLHDAQQALPPGIGAKRQLGIDLPRRRQQPERAPDPHVDEPDPVRAPALAGELVVEPPTTPPLRAEMLSGRRLRPR